VVTVTSTAPVPAGDVAVSDVALSAVMVPGVDPKSTAVAPDRSVPVTVTLVPPDGGPVDGLTPVTETMFEPGAVIVVEASGLGVW
jgi:hypothetical protein